MDSHFQKHSSRKPKRAPDNAVESPEREPCKSPIAALCERRWPSDFLEKNGGHRPPLQLKTPFAEVFKKVPQSVFICVYPWFQLNCPGLVCAKNASSAWSRGLIRKSK
jgi:hypothetical protein